MSKKLSDMTTEEIATYAGSASSMVEMTLPDGMPFFLMLMDIDGDGRITKGRSISMHMTQDQITQMFERGARCIAKGYATRTDIQKSLPKTSDQPPEPAGGGR